MSNLRSRILIGDTPDGLLSHEQEDAFRSATVALLDRFFADIGHLEAGGDFADTDMVEYLPARFLPKYDHLFANGEELRALLQRALAEGEVDRLRRFPWGIGSVFEQGPLSPSIGSAGVFMACRTRSGERYWRYYDVEGELITEEAAILRRIDPGSASGEDRPTIDLDTAWRAVAGSIIEEHNRRADPATSEESIGPIQRWALSVLRDPTVPLPEGASTAEAALRAERGGAVRQALGTIQRESNQGTISREEAARRIVDVVESYGLRPVDPPPPLDPISEDDLGVVCWMGVVTG